MELRSAAVRSLEEVITKIREAANIPAYFGKVYVVGGYLRDRELNLVPADDLDLVLEQDALEFAYLLHRTGISTHYPVTYPRFGTAMVHISDSLGRLHQVELVTARRESYVENSRKPDVTVGTLRDDVYRRDFTINTLVQNVHLDGLLDITGKALQDLADKVLRTPLDPQVTFFDDPLRMLRAVRFAAKLDFTIEGSTFGAIQRWAERLRSAAIANERIRDEFVKIAMLPGHAFAKGIRLLLQTGLLHQFMWEMEPMLGCIQGGWHIHDVWNHSLAAVELLPNDAPLPARLATLWHDIAKPTVRTEDEQGIHFYGHAELGATTVRRLMRRLHFSNDVISDTVTLVALHMKPGQYTTEWSDAAVRRFMREQADLRDQLMTVVQCDQGSMNLPQANRDRLNSLRQRIADQQAAMDVEALNSPLDGNEIMNILRIDRGPTVAKAKNFLTDRVIEGELDKHDKESATNLLKVWFEEYTDN